MAIKKEKLQELGFSEKEAGVYLTLLELGSSVASDIAKKAGINRSTTYIIIESLLKRGLVNVMERRGVKLYSSTSPDQLVRHLEETAKQYSGLVAAAKKILPDLESVRKMQKDKKEETSRPKVQLFEGREGIRTVYEDTLSSLESIRIHASKREALKTFPVSPEQFGNLPTISVYGDRIILVSPEEKFAAVVESRELADKLKKILETSRKELGGKESLVGTEKTAKGIA